MLRGSANPPEKLAAFLWVSPLAFVKERDAVANDVKVLLACLAQLAQYIRALVKTITPKWFNRAGELF